MEKSLTLNKSILKTPAGRNAWALGLYAYLGLRAQEGTAKLPLPEIMWDLDIPRGQLGDMMSTLVNSGLIKVETIRKTHNQKVQVTLLAEKTAPQAPQKAPESSVSPQDVLGAYRTHLNALPQPQALTGTRQAKVRARLKDFPELETWVKAFKKASRSSFLQGKSQSGWKASFDWFIANDTNLLKVLEGKYDDKTQSMDDYTVPTI